MSQKTIDSYFEKIEDHRHHNLELPYGIPSHDTFGRIFERMNPNEFQSCFMRWIKSVAEQTKGQVIAIDGKTLRRSHDNANEKKAIHMKCRFKTVD